jgi:hypothetical protein
MKRTNKITVTIILGIILLVGITLYTGAEEIFLPGITSTDDHPNGCIDCHRKASEDRDYRLHIELKNLEGHPDITNIVSTLPEGCLMCHKEGSKAGAMGLITHKFHYEHPAENHFVESYQGACLHCHVIDTNTWQMSIKSGSKNW